MTKVVKTDKAPGAIGPYSQGIDIGNMIFFSGQIPLDPETGVMPEGIEAQTRRALDNVKGLLESQGLTFKNVVKTTVFLDNIDDFLGLFIYRQATYATYTTLSSTKFEQKIEKKDSFILVAGDSSDNTMKSFQEVMTTYQTKNRKNKLYYVDTKGKSNDYLAKKLNVNVSTPCTFIIKNGKVTAKYPGALQYYYFKDFINANL